MLVGPLQQEDTHRHPLSQVLGGKRVRPFIHSPTAFCVFLFAQKPMGGRGEGLLSRRGLTPSALCLAASWPATQEICPARIQGSACDKAPHCPESNSSVFPQEPAREDKGKAVRSSPDLKLHIPATAAGLVSRQFSGAGWKGREGKWGGLPLWLHQLRGFGRLAPN